MWFLSGCRILFVVTAVAVVKTQMREAAGRGRDDQESETGSYELVSDVRSFLFSQCITAMNTVEGSLYSIAVDEDIEYVRFDASDSTRTVTWETESGIPDTVECAFAAHERGAFMFKFTRSAGCQLALGNAYDRSQPGCEGSEIVYMTSGDFCMTENTAYRVGETTDDFCPYNCTENGLVFAAPRNIEWPYLNRPECCFGSPNENGKCTLVWAFVGTMCQISDVCESFSLPIINLDNPEDADFAFDLVETGRPDAIAWTDVYKDDSGVWRHLASDEPVDSALWGPGEPSDAGRCAVITTKRYIAAASCDSQAAIFCLHPSPIFPICA